MDEHLSTRTDGYSTVSVVAHWLAAILIVALFFTHSATDGTAAYAFHVGGGAIAGLFLLWRVWHRVQRGMAHAPPQAAILNVAARFVHWGLLVLIAVVVVSGYLLSWSQGSALDVFGVGIPSPMEASPAFHEFLDRVHDVAGHLFIPLLALHVTGAIKHAVLDRRGTAMRMIRPAPGGQ